MDTAAIWLLRMFLKLLDLLDLNSLASLIVDDYYACREAFAGIYVQYYSTYACEKSIWIGYLLWVIVIAAGYLAYKRYKKQSQS